MFGSLFCNGVLIEDRIGVMLGVYASGKYVVLSRIRRVAIDVLQIWSSHKPGCHTGKLVLPSVSITMLKLILSASTASFHGGSSRYTLLLKS
jgi:hypothetical protein